MEGLLQAGSSYFYYKVFSGFSFGIVVIAWGKFRLWPLELRFSVIISDRIAGTVLDSVDGLSTRRSRVVLEE
ncbi:hypothetical protein V6Z11_A07G231900 [Gossypium hirsutum]